MSVVPFIYMNWQRHVITIINGGGNVAFAKIDGGFLSSPKAVRFREQVLEMQVSVRRVRS
jgi:hypothetical protein